jgi:type IV pilus assembly protein PilW
MHARTEEPHRGVTLVELLVALAASAIVLAFVVGAVKAQQEGYQGGQRVRDAQSSARNALLFIEQKLSLAGYGIDPVLAIDLTGQPGDNDPTLTYQGPCPADAAPCVKDRVDGSDELVFYARNPSYWVPPPDPPPPPGTQLQGRAWTVVAFNKATDRVTLAARANDVFPKGQILQGVCDKGAGQKYFTVLNTVRVGGADADTELELVPDALTDPFKRHNAAKCDPSRVFQVDRYRFHVRPVPLGGGRHEPYLMLDPGVDTNQDNVVDGADELIIAAGIEVMQVAYHFQFHAEGPNPAIPAAGMAAGVPIAVVSGAPNATIQGQRGAPAAATSTPAPSAIVRANFRSGTLADQEFYEQASLYPFGFGPPIANERKTNHQGNIRAVQVVLVGRSSSAAPEGATGALPGADAPVLNMNVTPAWIASWAAANGGRDGLERIRLETTVNLPSMVSRRLLFD